MKKKILIIGAGHEQVPAILLARKLGLEVIVTDQNRQAPGAEVADHVEFVSTADKAGNLAVAKKYAIDGVMTIGSETAVPVVAHVAAALQLPGFSEFTAYVATNKNAMRRQFAAFSVPTTESAAIASDEQAHAFVAAHGLPVVIKPSDSSGQRGTTRIDSVDQISSALKEALACSGDKQAIIEKYYAGPEINVTAAVEAGKIHFLSLSDRVTAEPPHFGIAIEHVAPAKLSESEARAIREASEKAIRAVGLENGIAYPQVLNTSDGPKVLEIAVRIPGGHMPEVALHSSGVDMIEFTILQAIGDVDALASCQRHPVSPALSVRFITALDFPAKSQVVSRVGPLATVMDIKGVKMARLNLQVGAPIPSLHHSGSRFGAILALGDTRAEACQRSLDASKKLQVDFEN